MTTRRALLGLTLVPFALALVGCDNVQTPQGKVTYLFKDARWYRSASFEGAQKGPTSTGWVWQMSGISFDYRDKTYEEPFEILVKDDINVSFEASVIISINSNQEGVREMIEGWGDKFYENLVKEPFRSITREVVGSYESREIRANRQAISERIKDLLTAKLDSYEQAFGALNPKIYKAVPVNIESVNIDNLEYPQQLREVISRTRELEKQLQQKETELEIAKKDKERAVMRARSLAKRMATIAGTLDDEYITNYAIEVAKKIATSECPTVVIIPTDPRAPGVPYVGSDRDEPEKTQEPGVKATVKPQPK